MLSIVVPCYNEAAVLPQLYRRVKAACDALSGAGAAEAVPWELLLVDDGSRDDTVERIRELARQDARVRGVLLSRNFGHQAAVSAGYDQARGRAVVVLDADLQHPPEVIPQFLEHWRAGYDVVYAYRRETKPRLFYRLHNWLCDVRIPREAADFRLLDRAVVDALRRMPERKRFVRGLVAWLGFRQIGIPYEQAERQAGRPAYTAWRRWRLALDSLVSFSTVPLRISVLLGLFTLTLGLLYALYIIGFLLVHGRAGMTSGWPALIITVLILGGVQLVCLGMVAEYIGRIYEEVKQRPLYVVRELTERTDSRNGPDRRAEPEAPARDRASGTERERQREAVPLPANLPLPAPPAPGRVSRP